MSNYQAASIRSGTRSSRKSTGSKRAKPRHPSTWAEPRYVSERERCRLILVSDVGSNATFLGLEDRDEGYVSLIYKAQGKNLTLSQVFEAWLKGDYALKRHAQAMNLCASRSQLRKLKAWAKALSIPLDSWQRELVEITLGGSMPKFKAEALPEVVPGPESLIYDTFEYKALDDCNFITCGGCATLEDKIQEQVYRNCDEPDAYAECVITVGDPWVSWFGCCVCGKLCDKTTANGFLIQFHGT